MPKEEVTVGPNDLSKRTAPIMRGGSAVMHFPVGSNDHAEHQYGSESHAKQAQGSFQYSSSLEKFWPGLQTGQWCFTGLCWGHVIDRLNGLLDDVVTWDIFPFVNSARGGGIDVKNEAHQKVADVGLDAALLRGERCWFVASSQAYRALTDGLQRRSAKEGRVFESVDVKVKHRGRQVTTKVVFLPTTGPVILLGSPHMSLLRFPFLAYTIVRTLFAFLDLLGLAPTDEHWVAIFTLIKGGLASREEEEDAFMHWTETKCTKEECDKARAMWVTGYSVWDIYNSIFGARGGKKRALASVRRSLRDAGVEYEDDADLAELQELALLNEVDVKFWGDLTASEAGNAAAASQLTDYVIKYHKPETGTIEFVRGSDGLPKVFYHGEGLDEEEAAERAKVEVERLGFPLAGVLMGGSRVRQGMAQRAKIQEQRAQEEAQFLERQAEKQQRQREAAEREALRQQAAAAWAAQQLLVAQQLLARQHLLVAAQQEAQQLLAATEQERQRRRQQQEIQQLQLAAAAQRQRLLEQQRLASSSKQR